MFQSRLAPGAVLLLLSLAGCRAGIVGPADDARQTEAKDGAAPGATPSLQTNCEKPAPLLGAKDPKAPGYIVVFQEGTDASPTARALSAKYQFQTKFVYTSALLGFAAELPDAVVAALRCESAVKYIQHDGAVSITG